MKIKRNVRLAGLLLAGLPALAFAADPKQVAAPAPQAGDTWVYDRTHEQGTNGFKQERVDLTVERVGSDTMVVGIKPDGAIRPYEDHMMGLDWSMKRMVGDTETITGRPFTFPLTVGETWVADFDDPRHIGNRTSSHVHNVYKVVGWEDVTTPAGTFHAIKIESNGAEDAHVTIPASAVSGTVAGPNGSTAVANAQRGASGVVHLVNYSELYYAPEVKYFVKTLEEHYNSENVRTSRDSQTLVSFKPAQPGAAGSQPNG